MGIDWQSIENFFIDDRMLFEKVNETIESFLKFRGLFDEEKKKKEDKWQGVKWIGDE